MVRVLRGYALFLYFDVWRIYANKKLVAKIHNCQEVSFVLPPGEYDLMINCPQAIFFNKRKGLYSNTIHIKIEDSSEYYLDVRPHPLIWWGRHHPSNIWIFKPVECLILMDRQANFNAKMERLAAIDKVVRKEVAKFNYHLFSLILVVAFSLVAISSNILFSQIYETPDGLPWGFLFGIGLLFGLCNTMVNKQLMARGWEYKLVLLSSFYFVLIIFLMKPGYFWQKMIYIIFILIGYCWGINRYKHWRRAKKRLDEMERREFSFDEQ